MIDLYNLEKENYFY